MNWKLTGLIAALAVLVGSVLVISSRARPSASTVTADEASLGKEIGEVRQELRKLSKDSSRLSKRLGTFSQGRVIVVDTSQNKLSLLRGEKVLLEATCSTGSGLQLDDPVEGRSWVFKTPRGEFRVLSKLVNPVWRKPDWAFVEEGERPPEDVSERLEAGVLGDYALAFGDGYFIHGTLYTRLLGTNVTHGCIRLGDRDLEQLYRQVPVGTPVVVF